MKIKAVSGIMLTLLLTSMSTLALDIQPVSAIIPIEPPKYPTIYIEPVATVDPTLTPGSMYTISIKTDYTGGDVCGWQFSLYYNPNVLYGVEVTNGDLISNATHPDARFMRGTFDNVAGELSLTGAFFFFTEEPAPVTSGPGTLANVTFIVRGYGTSDITFVCSAMESPLLVGYSEGVNPDTGETEPGWGEEYDIVDGFVDFYHISHGYFQNTARAHIRADGTIDPPTAPFQRDGDVYTFTDNIYGSIVVDRSNIIIDGNGYTLQGSEDRYGFFLSGIDNVTIQNTNIKDFVKGVKLYQSSFVTVSGNNVTNNYRGISLPFSSNNNISGNKIAANRYQGIELWTSSNNSISGNTITDNSDGVFLSSSSNNTVSGNNVTNNWSGIELDNSSNNTISGNNITNNWRGIKLYESSSNSISGNTITNNHNGIRLSSSPKNTLSGNHIKGNERGVWIVVSHETNFCGNNVTNNDYGIELYGSSSNSISGNKVVNNGYGIKLVESSNNVLRDNVMAGNEKNFGVYGERLSHFVNDVDASNTVNGKPILYLVDRQNLTINPQTHPDIGYLAVINSTNVIVQHLNVENNGQGVLLACTKDSIIQNVVVINNVVGMQLTYSSNNSITGNNITNNHNGILLEDSSNYNIISGNNITNNNCGIEFYGSSNNTLRNNDASNNKYNFGVYGSLLSDYIQDIDDSNTVNGRPVYYWVNRRNMAVPLDAGWIALINCTRITVENLNLANNTQGVLLAFTTSSTITKNNITNNREGIYLCLSSNNSIYHNNFVNNTAQTYVTLLYINNWDNGYPSGGNYWSDYEKKFPNAKELDGSGIWDIPYVINRNNQDNYPLMEPWTPAPPAVIATADVAPNTLNLKSKGKWITCYIELPEGYNVSDIDIYTIRLNNTFPVSLLVNPPVPAPTEIGDYDNDGVPDLMVKFNRTTLTSHIYHTLAIEYGNVTLTITGELSDGTPFESRDTVKVILGGDADLSGLVELDDFYIWRENFGRTPEQCPPDVYPDFDNNELVELPDFYIWMENFGAHVPPPP